MMDLIGREVLVWTTDDRQPLDGILVALDRHCLVIRRSAEKFWVPLATVAMFREKVAADDEPAPF